MSDIRRLARYIARYRFALALAIASAVIASGFLGGAIGLVNPLVRALAQADDRPDLAAGAEATLPDRSPAAAAEPDWVQRGRERIARAWEPIRRWLMQRPYARIPLAIVFLYLLKGLFGFLSVFAFRSVGLRAVADLRSDLYRRALDQSDEFYREHTTAEMLSRILNDCSRLQNALGHDIGQALQSIPIVLVVLFVALWHAPAFTGVCLVAIPVFAVVAGRIGRRVKKATRRSQERSADLASRVEETLLARRVVQAFGATEQENARFRAVLERMLRQDLRVARAVAATPPIMELLGAVAGAVLIVYAGSLRRAGLLDGGDMFVAIIAIFFAFTHVRKLGQLHTVLQQALASARRVFDVLDAPVRVRNAPGAVRIERFEREIRFESVGFSYGRGPVLQGIDLVIRAGEVHALVGPSGAGKSTLAMLVPRFHDPTEGRVLLDGRDLRTIDLSSLRALVGVVTQEVHLFDDTVAANIAYGQPDASRDRIVAAARAAHADPFIRRLPEGYDTRLGERGGQLSMGQRQRIAIARAFLQDAPILVLDEPTSALDAESERAVQEALEALLVGRTAIVIAHRLFTVERADVIHVLEAGRIVESGHHRELIDRRGVYHRLHALQTRHEVPPRR